MDELLRSPVRAFTVDDQVEASRQTVSRERKRVLFASEINLTPVSDPDELDFLTGLMPFHQISNKLLFKLVRVATGIEVRDRWVAIRAVIAKRIPIPVPTPHTEASTPLSRLQSHS